MKSCEEMTASVLRRAKAQQAVRKRRNRSITYTTALCLALVMLTGINFMRKSTDDPHPDASGEETSGNISLSDDPNELAQSPRLVLLCADMEGASEQTLTKDVKVPYNTVVRVRDIADVTEERLLEIIKEEDAYIEQMPHKCPEGVSYGRYRGDNLLISSIHDGCFAVKFSDLNAVESMKVSVTDNGLLWVYPKVDGCWHIAQKNGVDTDIELTGEGIRTICKETVSGGVEMYWQISNSFGDEVDQSKNIDLSGFCDTITITVNYTDGGTDETVVDMYFGEENQVFAVLRETTEMT